MSDTGEKVEDHDGMSRLIKEYYENIFAASQGVGNQITDKKVFCCCKDWLSHGSFPAEVNNTNIVLIPKKTDASCLKDYRPIALCNVLYKIVAKVLANRLKAILPNMNSENQSAFVPGRSITDNVLIAFEVIHHMRRKTGGRDGEVALKLHISKAYDRLDWDFLRHHMKTPYEEYGVL